MATRLAWDMPFNDLREFIEATRAIGDLKEIHGAHWDLEIGALTELFAEREGPLLLFDGIPGYPPSFRVASNLITHPRRSALAAGMSPDISRTELIVRWKRILKELRPIAPETVTDGPLFENVRTGDSVDMIAFPVPRWHELDGGRYLGTACCVITADPDGGGSMWGSIGCSCKMREP